jgi:hypothetical protein
VRARGPRLWSTNPPGRSTGEFKLIDTYRVENGNYVKGAPAINALGCSAHRFELHPTWHNGVVVALAYYEHGTHFLDVDKKGRVERKGPARRGLDLGRLLDHARHRLRRGLPKGHRHPTLHRPRNGRRAHLRQRPWHRPRMDSRSASKGARKHQRAHLNSCIGGAYLRTRRQPPSAEVPTG